MQNGYGGIPMPIRGYGDALREAKKLLGDEDLYFKRLVRASLWEVQIFIFANRTGDKVALKTRYAGVYKHSVEIADMKKVVDGARKYVRGWYRFIGENTDRAASYQLMWRNIQEKVPDSLAEQELPIKLAAASKENGRKDEGPVIEYYDEVPDPEQGSRICWSCAVAAIFTCHAQHGGPRFIEAPDPNRNLAWPSGTCYSGSARLTLYKKNI